jgi:hypothetical protein
LWQKRKKGRFAQNVNLKFMLTEQEKSNLRALVQSGQWPILQRLGEEMVKMIKSNSPVRETSEATLREVYTQEGQIEGIKRFLQEIFNQVS